ncbi:MAG: hypothetical protein GF364_03625 [Candidatus Lokiarchaeota archaeon]|nr:hypothetical protein [Candidatus Lokiarchaeota archaeon]
MPNKNVRFYDKISKKTVILPLPEKFKESVMAAAGDFFPYPVIISHDGHYTIIHLDPDFNDRGTVQTKILVNLDDKPIGNHAINVGSTQKINDLSQLSDEVIREIVDIVKKEFKKHLSKKSPSKKKTKDIKKKSSKSKKKTSKNKKDKSSTKKITLDELSGMGLDD